MSGFESSTDVFEAKKASQSTDELNRSVRFAANVERAETTLPRDYKQKRKSINIDTSNMLILEKHQLKMKVNSAFKFTKMLGDRRPREIRAVHDEPALTFDFPNSRAAGIIHFE